MEVEQNEKEDLWHNVLRVTAWLTEGLFAMLYAVFNIHDNNIMHVHIFCMYMYTCE